MSHAISRLLVPAYFHPDVEPASWDALLDAAPALAAVVINPDSGVGPTPDAAYAAVAARLQAAGARVLGYVDTDYARRPHHEVVAELETYRAWYGVDGVFFDQTPASSDALPHYCRLVVAARSLDACWVVLNPGCRPHPAYLDLADLVVTFEGDWSTYQGQGHSPDAGCHLVYSAPPGATAHGYATPGELPNPWAVLGTLTAPRREERRGAVKS
ncbi:hypothetical protein ABIA32_001921 [Streptacidiphilus sp. MAP12-20]|uniref:spherulation-specific family 4 protein n=1 Tax=Streptacidiphilus sp. MAP12-20 TaxID=3156299 RepID=UPI0035176B99